MKHTFMKYVPAPVKALAILVFSLSIIAPTASAVAADIEPYSWYGSTLRVEAGRSWTGSTRYYDGSNAGIEMTCESYGSGSFNVELHRAHGLFNDWIGTAKFPVNGFHKATWTNVGSGNYYYKFVNGSDSSVSSSDVAMYSW